MTIEETGFFSKQTIIFQDFLWEDRLSKLEEDFKNKFNLISTWIDSVESSLKRTIEQLQPQELSERLSIIEEYQRILKYKEEVAEIDEDVRASEEAANWLDRNRTQLINYVQQHIFTIDNSLKGFSKLKLDKVSTQLFCQDLDFYLRWIAHFLRMGKMPNEMPKGVIALVVPSEIYIEAFKIIRNDKVSTSSGLSERAVIMLRSSINRFLIKRDLKLDASD